MTHDNKDLGVLEWLEQINAHGLSIVEGVPVTVGGKPGVAAVASRIATLMPNLYGDVFDVIATPNPINIAYTPAELKLHLDLPYYESPPGLQVSLCE